MASQHTHAATMPIYADPIGLACIAAGGFLGVVCRAGLATSAGHLTNVISFGTLLANLIGALCLGLIYGTIRALTRVPLTLRRMQLFAGSGFMGAFTTYSTFMYEVVSQGQIPGGIPIAIAYAAGSLLGGVVYAWLGILLATMMVTIARQSEQHSPQQARELLNIETETVSQSQDHNHKEDAQ